MWNSLPGGLYVLPQFSTDAAVFPFYYSSLGELEPINDLVLCVCITDSSSIRMGAVETQSQKDQTFARSFRSSFTASSLRRH